MKLKEFERLRGATAIGESEKKAMSDQLKSLAEKNRSEKRRMDELLEGVIHSQKGELEKRKAEYVDLQVRCLVCCRCSFVENQRGWGWLVVATFWVCTAGFGLLLQCFSFQG